MGHLPIRFNRRVYSVNRSEGMVKMGYGNDVTCIRGYRAREEGVSVVNEVDDNSWYIN